MHILFVTYIVAHERTFQISLREFHAAKDVLCEFLIDSAPIAPRRRSIKIIEELIKSGDLCRFERLVRDQFSFQNSENSTANGRAWKWVPGNSKLRIKLVRVFEFSRVTRREVAAGAESERHVF